MPFYKYPFCRIQDATRFPISRWFAAFVAVAGSLWSPCTPGSQSAEQQRWHLPKTPFWLGASPLSNTLAEYSVLSPLKSSLQFLAFYRLFRHWWFSSNPIPELPLLADLLYFDRLCLVSLCQVFGQALQLRCLLLRHRAPGGKLLRVSVEHLDQTHDRDRHKIGRSPAETAMN